MYLWMTFKNLFYKIKKLDIFQLVYYYIFNENRIFRKFFIKKNS